MFCCQVHVFEKCPNTLLLNTIIKYNINKHSEPLFQKSNFSPPGDDKFFELLYTPKNISIVLRSRGEGNTDFVSFVTILPIFAAKRPDYLLHKNFKQPFKGLSSRLFKLITCRAKLLKCDWLMRRAFFLNSGQKLLDPDWLRSFILSIRTKYQKYTQ